MVFAVEIRFVDGESIDELLDFPAGVGTQAREITRERAGARRQHALEHAALHVVALGFGEDHPGATVDEFTEPAELVFAERREFSHGIARIGL
jgi:hypothetical protein